MRNFRKGYGRPSGLDHPQPLGRKAGVGWVPVLGADRLNPAGFGGGTAKAMSAPCQRPGPGGGGGPESSSPVLPMETAPKARAGFA